MENSNYRRLTIMGQPASVSGRGAFFESLASDSFDEPAFRTWSSYLADDAICLDVGANVGLTSLALSRVAASGKVYAIEPDDESFEFLQSNITANHARNIEPIHALVGVDRQSKSFFINESDPTGSTSIATGEAGGSVTGLRAVNKQTISLDRLCAERQINNIDFIKIDVEGAELEVLAGAWDILARYRPLVQVEFNAHTLMNFGNWNPREALREIRRKFPYVWRLSKIDGSLESIPDDYAFMYENVLKHGCVDDLICGYEIPVKKRGSYYYDHQQVSAELVVTRGELGEMTRQRDELDALLATVKAEVEQITNDAREMQREMKEVHADLIAQRNALRQQVAALRTEVSALRGSTSWKLTAPFRAIVSKFNKSST